MAQCHHHRHQDVYKRQEFKRAQTSVTELPHARDFLEFCRARQLRTFLLSTVHADHFKVQCRVIGFDVFLDKPYTDVWDKREKMCIRDSGDCEMHVVNFQQPVNRVARFFLPVLMT